MTAIAEFSVVPLGKGISLSEYIAKAVKIVENSGLKYELTAMGTVVEGDLDKVLYILKECHNEMLKYSDRVLTRLVLDERKDKTSSIEGKVNSVKKHLS